MASLRKAHAEGREACDTGPKTCSLSNSNSPLVADVNSVSYPRGTTILAHLSKYVSIGRKQYSC